MKRIKAIQNVPSYVDIDCNLIQSIYLNKKIILIIEYSKEYSIINIILNILNIMIQLTQKQNQTKRKIRQVFSKLANRINLKA